MGFEPSCFAISFSFVGIGWRANSHASPGLTLSADDGLKCAIQAVHENLIHVLVCATALEPCASVTDPSAFTVLNWDLGSLRSKFWGLSHNQSVT